MQLARHLMFLDPMADHGPALDIVYDPMLVIASYGMGALGSYAALLIGEHLRAASGNKQSGIWLLAGGVAMGLGVWSMHFLAMLAVQLAIPVTYDVLVTGLSMLPAAFAGAVCLSVLHRSNVSGGKIILAGITMGAGIGTMHYVGMGAMRMNADMLYDLGRFLLSIVVAVVLASASLYMRVATRNLRRPSKSVSLVTSALIMGSAITAMHYTGMWAVFFFPADTPAPLTGISTDGLALAVGVVATAIIGLIIAGSAIGHRLEQARSKADLNLSRLMATVDNIPEGFILFDETRRAVVWNHVFEGMLPERKDVLKVGATYDEIFQRPSLGSERQLSDGRWVNVKESATESGKRAVLWTDVTARKKVEEALRKSEQKYRSIIDTAHEGIWLLDTEGTVTYVNPRMADILGYAADEMVGRAISAFMGEDVNEKTVRNVEQGITDLSDFRLRHKDGFNVWLTIAATPMTDDSGNFAGALGMVSDITERRQLEEQVRHMQKMEAVGQLTGGIAHDFNNLLTVVVGNLQLVEESAKNDDVLLGQARAALDAALRGAELTRRLLAFSRRQLLAPKVININDLVANVEPLLHRTLGEYIEIEKQLSDDLWQTEIDPSQLESAIVNLAVNARDAMPDGGKLTIETRNIALDERYASSHADISPGEYVLLVVSDSGTGISRDALRRVFDPFFTTKETGKGTGLGLSMVYGFVKQSKGNIKIYSEEGHGTSVRVYLPRAEASSDGLAASSSRRARIQGGSETILVVEDDPGVREIGVSLLKGLGYAVLESSSGPEALALLNEEHGVDLLFTDMVMPGGMTGAELAVQARRHNGNLKVLYTSGYTDTVNLDNGLLQSGDLMLNKPYQKHELAEAVRDVLDQTIAA